MQNSEPAVQDFTKWLSAAAQGERFEYAKQISLDRERRPGCTDIAYRAYLDGEVELFQIRHRTPNARTDVGLFSYIAVKK